MLINTPVSLGELLDKISILIIKEKNIVDTQKQYHIKNDKRSKIKLEINKKFGSELVEVKSYEKY